MNKKQLLDTLNERPTFSIKEKGGNVKLIEIKKVKELKKLEEKLNKGFSNKVVDLTVKLGFASREITVQNLDLVFVNFKHPDIQDAGIRVYYKNLNRFNFMMLEFRIQKWAKQHLKDWLGRQNEN